MWKNITLGFTYILKVFPGNNYEFNDKNNEDTREYSNINKEF